MVEFFIGPFLVWFPRVFLGVILILSVALYFRQNLSEPRAAVKYFKRLAVVTASFYFLYASMETLAQYYVWSRDSFSKLFLPPYQDLSYFVFYSFGRFWLNAMLAALAALVFYFFLRMLSRHRGGLFKEGEKELGFIMALVSGWPGIVLFIPLVFVITVILAIVRLVIFKLRTTTLGLPFIISAATVLLWGSELITLFHLNVLKV